MLTIAAKASMYAKKMGSKTITQKIKKYGIKQAKSRLRNEVQDRINRIMPKGVRDVMQRGMQFASNPKGFARQMVQEGKRYGMNKLNSYKNMASNTVNMARGLPNNVRNFGSIANKFKRF
jgi:hypothetical protein